MTDEMRNLFCEELKEKTLAECGEMLAAMDEEVRSATEIEEIELRTEKKTILLERMKELKALEERKADALALQNNEVTGETIEERGKEKMAETRIFGVESAEYREAFLCNLMGKPQVEERAYATGDTYTAIPTITSEKMFEKMKKLAPMLSEITLLRASGNVKFVVEGTRNAATKHTENNTMSAAQDTIVTVSLGAYEFMKVIEISKNALNQSIDAFEQFLIDMLAGDIARAIDNYILNDSTNGIKSATYTTGTNQVVSTINYSNIVKLVGMLPAAYDSEAKFLMHKSTLWNDIAGIVNSNGDPIFVPNTGEGIGKILGYDVVVDDYVGTTGSQIYLGKWSDVVGNLSQDIEVTSDEHAGFYAATVPFRGYATFDSKPAKMDGICRLVTTTSGI